MAHTNPRDLSRLSRSPRAVPISLQARVVFGGVLGIVGWSLAAFGGVFVLVFGSLVDLTSFEGCATTSGWSSGWEETSVEVNEEPVVANRFSYEVDGRRYEGTSYATAVGLDAETPIVVEYLPDRPEVARIQGMRTSEFSGWVLAAVAVLPVVGLLMGLVQIFRGRRNLRLLRWGQVGEGRLVDKKRTSTRINQRYVWALTFELTDSLGRVQRVVSRTIRPAALEDDAAEPLIYDPARPTRALLIDSAPNLYRVSAAGGWEGLGALRGTLALILPLLGLALNGLAFLVV